MPQTGWPFVGSDQGTHQVLGCRRDHRRPIGDLEIIWQWEPNETPLAEHETQPGQSKHSVMVDSVLYLSTM